MKLLAIHPSALMYTRIFLRLEPLGLELVAAAAIAAGHDVRLIDLQVERHRDLLAELDRFRPDAVCFSGNYLANIPEIIDLARIVRTRLPDSFVIVGGHSASFVAEDMIRQSAGAIDAVLRGEGESGIAPLLAAGRGGDLARVPGAITATGAGPPPRFVDSLDTLRPARRPAAAPAKVFHRRARSVRFGRVRTRLPMGLHVLQRVDLLRPQLSHCRPRSRGRGGRALARARRVHRR